MGLAQARPNKQNIRKELNETLHCFKRSLLLLWRKLSALQKKHFNGGNVASQTYVHYFGRSLLLLWKIKEAICDKAAPKTHIYCLGRNLLLLYIRSLPICSEALCTANTWKKAASLCGAYCSYIYTLS